jgi:hypothetical protein
VRDGSPTIPRGQFPKKTRVDADNVANVAFISGDVNRAINQSGPEVYLQQLTTEVLESQCIPTEKDLWSISRADDFWSARRKLLAAAFNDFVKDALPKRRI